MNNYNLLLLDIRSIFEVEARKYESITANIQETSRRRPTSLTFQYFEGAIYENQNHQHDQKITTKIS